MVDLYTLPYPDLLQKIRNLIPPDQQVYLVGGAVRDLLLGRPIHDLDFVITGDVRKSARMLANVVNGAFFMLDEKRDTARIICPQQDNFPQCIDIASFRSETLDQDLKARDFTINAIAIDLDNPQKLIDPLGGAVDLKEKRLRVCSPTSFMDDPLRIIRGIRMSLDLKARLTNDTICLMRESMTLLEAVSPERIRDELFRILDGVNVHTGIRLLEQLGVLSLVLPELHNLTAQENLSLPSDKWHHTLTVLRNLEMILKVFPGKEFGKDGAPNLSLGLVMVKLGRFRNHLEQYFTDTITADRTKRALLFFTALYYDFRKPGNITLGAGDHTHSNIRENTHVDVIHMRARMLALSGAEIKYLEMLIDQQLAIHTLAVNRVLPNRKEIYRFFRQSGDAGVAYCILMLADLLATFECSLDQELWIAELEVCRVLLQAWWEQKNEIIDPPRFLNGEDIQQELGMPPGPLMGKLLEAIQEAQAGGEVLDRQQALQFANNWIRDVL